MNFFASNSLKTTSCVLSDPAFTPHLHRNEHLIVSGGYRQRSRKSARSTKTNTDTCFSADGNHDIRCSSSLCWLSATLHPSPSVQDCCLISLRPIGSSTVVFARTVINPAWAANLASFRTSFGCKIFFGNKTQFNTVRHFLIIFNHG